MDSGGVTTLVCTVLVGLSMWAKPAIAAEIAIDVSAQVLAGHGYVWVGRSCRRLVR